MEKIIFNITYGQSIIKYLLIKQMVSEKQLFIRTDGESIIDHSQKFVILPIS